jgi:hypothetical protein
LSLGFPGMISSLFFAGFPASFSPGDFKIR